MAGKREAPLLYRILKRILQPTLNPLFHIYLEGLENIPRKGGAILACNHLSFIDSIFLPLNVPRTVYFLGKADYFAGWQRWFFEGVGVIPVYREGGEKGRQSLEMGMEILRRGDLLGIYPEGTRSPDGRLYRGKTGPVRMAIESGAPVLPCAVLGTREVMQEGKKLPRRRPVEIRYGEPLDFSRYAGEHEDPFVLRSATDELMYEIMTLSGQEYVDEYASSVKTGKVTLPDDVAMQRSSDRDRMRRAS